MTPAIRLLAATFVMCALVAGCGSTEKKESKMTPDEANRELTAVARAVMEVLVPGKAVDVDGDGPATPCGGLGGNEYSKVKYGLSLDIAPGLDQSTLFTSAGDKLRDLGYSVTAPETMGENTTLTFHGDAVSGDLTDHGDGQVSFGAETECLDNPDKDDPFPDVQPSS